jgi:CDP-diacylglycerol--glycerol-3-phosphate 3-phosphatidyltransferase
MFRHVPNLLTGLRLVLAFVFFAMLSWYQYEGRGDPTFLNVAFVIYLVALLTDYFDGYLARKWHVEGTFGRILDPFVDKVLVLGSFIFFAGKNFIIPDTEVAAMSQPMVVKTITGVAPAMVVVLLARELLVTSLRGLSESAGQNFGAVMAGKVKMVLQSVTILIILVYVNYLPWLRDHRAWELGARIVRDVFIWLTLVVTVGSSLSYIRRAIALYQAKRDDKSALTK